MKTETGIGSGMRRSALRHVLGRAAVLLAGTLVLALAFAACGIGGNNSSASSNVTINVKVKTGGQAGATLVLLPVTIGGRGPYTFALDTGAAVTLVDTPLAAELGLPQVGPPSQVSGVASNEKATPIKISNWHIESLNLPDVIAVSANLFSSQRGQGLQGLVGSDVWRMFGTVSIDYSAQTVTVPKQVASALFGPTLSLGTPVTSHLAAVRPGWEELHS